MGFLPGISISNDKKNKKDWKALPREAVESPSLQVALSALVGISHRLDPMTLEVFSSLLPVDSGIL